MSDGRSSFSKKLAIALGVLTTLSVGALVASDAGAAPWIPRAAHDGLAAVGLGLVALAYLAYQGMRRASAGDWAKAVLLAAAFLAWAANQVWPDHAQAVLLNDAAITAFVLDVLLTMLGWPASASRTVVQ